MDAHKNFALSTLSSPPSGTEGTELTVATGHGTRFPAVPFNVTLWPAGVAPTVSNAEIVRVTAKATDTFTVTRAQEGTSARTHSANDQIAATITARTLTDVEYGAHGIVNVKDPQYGAVGDGVTDDTAAIQRAIDAAGDAGGGVVLFPSGLTYAINASDNLTGLQMRSRVTLHLTGATLQAIPANSANYRIINIQEVTDCAIIGGTIVGDRASNAASGEQGHCIYIILDCERIRVQNVTLRDAFGDGIYIGRLCSDIVVSGCTITNNRRNNVSIVSASSVVIESCDISNANGVSPEAGVDVEPNVSDAVSTGVIIANCNIYDNAQNGVAFPAPPPTPLIEDAIVANCHIYGNGAAGIRASYVKNLLVSSNIIHDNGAGGIVDTAALPTFLSITDNVIYDNTGDGVSGFASNTRIANNTISNSSGYGISWQLGELVSITNNTILTSGEGGIYILRGYNAVINGNIVSNSQKHGIWISGTAESTATRSRKVVVSGNTVSFSSLATDDTYSGIYLDQFTLNSAVTGNTVTAGTTGNLPLHAIYTVDASVFVANNQAAGGAKTGNANINAGGVSFPDFLLNPNFLSDTYADRFYMSGLRFISAGSGTPEGALAAPVGSLFLRTDGGAATSLYVKESGSSTTGWVGK